jgi:hypothetical protein
MHSPILASVAVLIAAGTGSTAAASQLSRMTALYNQVCIKAFPDDKAVEALMTGQRARPLTPEAVKVTMRDDPARAWELQDGSATVWIEFPPFHACSVRWNASDIGDLHEYRAIADRYEKATGGFSVVDPYDADEGDIHIHAVGEQRVLPDKGRESLFIFDQRITDPKRRAAGETGYVLRLVHQYAAPGAK